MVLPARSVGRLESANEAGRAKAAALLGSPELMAAAEVVARGACRAWFRFALEAAPRGLGIGSKFELLGALCQLGYEQLAGLSGSVTERDEISPRSKRIELLRAVATIEGSVLS